MKMKDVLNVMEGFTLGALPWGEAVVSTVNQFFDDEPVSLDTDKDGLVEAISSLPASKQEVLLELSLKVRPAEKTPAKKTGRRKKKKEGDEDDKPEKISLTREFALAYLASWKRNPRAAALLTLTVLVIISSLFLVFMGVESDPEGKSPILEFILRLLGILLTPAAPAA